MFCYELILLKACSTVVVLSVVNSHLFGVGFEVTYSESTTYIYDSVSHFINETKAAEVKCWIVSVGIAQEVLRG